MREYKIEPGGLVIGEPLREFQGVLTGTPALVGGAEPGLVGGAEPGLVGGAEPGLGGARGAIG